jgi:C4-dicarboxylate transporter DctM subunit
MEMPLFLVLSFVGLLVLSTPISMVLLATTAGALYFFLGVPLTALVQQLFGGLDNFLLLAIPFFILAGNIMAEGRIAEYLVSAMKVLVGRVPGGMALAGILTCMFFAAISGSSPATVIAVGSIMIPALVRDGYDERFSTGLITSSGTLGILIPPSIPMVLFSLVGGTSVGDMFMAGIVPGVMRVIVFGSFAVYMAMRFGWGHREAYSFGESARILGKASWGLAMPVIVLGGIYSGVFTPTEAAAVSVVYALFVETCIYRSLNFDKMIAVIRNTAVLSSALLFIIACAMPFVWLLTREQLPGQAAAYIGSVVTNKYMFLFLVNIFLLFIGCVMDIVSAILVLTPIFLPMLDMFGIDPVHWGIIMIVNVEMGFLTFPFGLNLFVAMGLTGKPLTYIARSVLPFMALLVLCLLAVTYIPEISTWLPGVLK